MKTDCGWRMLGWSILCALLGVLYTTQADAETVTADTVTYEEKPNRYLEADAAEWSFPISEWSPYIRDIKVWVDVSEHDEGGNGHPKMCIRKYKQDRTLFWEEQITFKGNGGHSFERKNRDTVKEYIMEEDTEDYVRLRVEAPRATWDDAEIRVKEIRLYLTLSYNITSVEIDGAPRVLDFGEIDIGNDNSQSIIIRHIGARTGSKDWRIKSDQPGWIEATKGSVSHGSTATIPIRMLSAQIKPANVDELRGTLVPIYDAVDPKAPGLKGDFYHIPTADLGGLLSSFNLEDKRLVYSAIFPTIEFNQGTGNEAWKTAYGLADDFTSGDIAVPARRDFVARFTGFIKIEKAGTYEFLVSSDDGFELKVDNTIVTYYRDPRGTAESSGTRDLSQGYHPIELTYFQGKGGKSLTLRWRPPGGQIAVVPSSVLSNGLNVLVKAQPKKPTIRSTTPVGSNNKVNVAVKQSQRFTVRAEGRNTGVSITSYAWRIEPSGGAAGSGTGSDSERSGTFDQPGEYTVFCKAVDAKGVASDEVAIPVRAWIRPTVTDTPPDSAIAAGMVSWYNGKYVGVAGGPVRLMADGAKGSSEGDEYIERYLWDLDNNWDTIEIEQPQNPLNGVHHVWDNANLSGRIRCRAVTNYGVQSDEKLFDLKVYGALQVDAGGPYSGRPRKPVELKGSVNTGSYPGANSMYQWRVGSVHVATDGNGTGKYTWTADGDYDVWFGAIVTTQEGVTLTDSVSTTVHIESGVPTAMPGGPYRGGIAGGNFSPIPLEGNPPNFEEAEDIGKIVQWEWFFSGGKGSALQFDGVDDYVECGGGASLKPASFTVSAWINADTLGANPFSAYIVSKGRDYNPSKGFGLCVGRDNGTPVAYFWIGSGDKNRTNGTVGTISANRWYHLAATYEEGVGSKLYINGNLVHSNNAYTGAIVYDSSPVRIGKLSGGYYHFDGRIDEVRIWNRALTPAEIQVNKSKVLTGTEEGLVGYWPLDEGSGTTTADQSPNRSSGTLYGGGAWVSMAEATVWNPSHAYPQAGEYTVHLRVQSESGKWSAFQTTTAHVIDGKITGFVRAADLRTPVRNVRLTLTSSHVAREVLAAIAASDTTLHTDTAGEGGIWTETDEKGYYVFDHLPLGSYKILASKMDGEAHEFETSIKVTELTLDAPNQLAIDFVDLSVFPVGGRIVYSIQKNGADVWVEGVEVKAQPVGAPSLIEALPSTKSPSATGTNYSVPLFAGKYLFLAKRPGHDIRIKEGLTGYEAKTGLVTIEGARTDIDFVDHTTRTLTVFIRDSGGYAVSTYPETGDPIQVTVSGPNGQISDKPVDAEKATLVDSLNPGTYTVTVKGAEPETKEVDLTAGDEAVTMTIPVQIVLTIVSPKPKLFDIPKDFLEETFDDTTLRAQLSLYNHTEGFLFYYPPSPQGHVYRISATANGRPVEGFSLTVTDDISQMTPDAPEPQGPLFSAGDSSEVTYVTTAGLPRLNREVTPPVAAPKWIKFRAEKEGYKKSDVLVDSVIVLGDVSVGAAAQVVSIPNVNYLVLHDPPGDGSYAYLDDSMTIKGVVASLKLESKDMDVEIPVYPSPWTKERDIEGYEGESDLRKKGLLGYKDADPTLGWFGLQAAIEAGTGALAVATGPLAYVVQLVKMVGYAAIISEVYVQYEISPNRHLETPSGDDLPDLLGPGRGDIYYGEGWTLGLQQKYRLGIEWNAAAGKWTLATSDIMTYDILDRTNQYVYTIRDIEHILANLKKAIKKAREEGKADTAKLEKAQTTWEELLEKNLAYQWDTYYVATEDKIAAVGDRIEALESKGAWSEEEEAELSSLHAYLSALEQAKTQIEQAEGDAFEAFKKAKGGALSDKSETLIFSAGPTFEYSRRIAEGDVVSFSQEIGVETSAEFSHELEISVGFKAWGSGTEIDLKSGASASINTGVGYGKELESGEEMEQTVGFVLNDDDIGDNIATRVYEDPVWGTPLFFQDPGSVTSDPWEPGTNQAVDVEIALVKEPATDDLPFDYHDGAHYKVNVTYAGERKLESAGIGFVLYASPTDNAEHLTVRFNGNGGPYGVELSKESPSATIAVSVYPPEMDAGNSEEKEYSVAIAVEEEEDAQVGRALVLKPTFADLRAPRAIITAPYEGERISPVLFPAADATQGIEEKPFQIQVVSENTDLSRIQLQIRSKQPDGVWEPWSHLSGMIWEEDGENPNVTVFDRLDRDPPRREFTFKWTEEAIKSLGVGEYALRAVATDKATRRDRPDFPGNVDLDPPAVVFVVDDSKPSVLTTIPDYQARESQRIYRGELSATFTDDMRPTDFSDRTFSVTDLLDNSNKVAGYVSYSPALRKAVFVPMVPFQPNGFYRAEVKTDAEQADGTIERGVHDVAGNPLDNAMVWTFRTTDAPFEPTWSIALRVTDGTGKMDANNIAGVEYGALDGEDEQDVRAVPPIASQLRLSFLDRDKVEWDRDIRPADGRLSHHWFLVVNNAALGDSVTIRWRPSIKLTRSTRQYQIIRLVEFNADGTVRQTIPMDPTQAGLDPETGLIREIEAYTYLNADETSRYFRLDVQKVGLVATTFPVGSSGWRFLSVPITPLRADPFVNLGDDMDPFKLYWYDTKLNGYKVYPLDLGDVSLQTGHGYFTRLDGNVEVDVGGSKNVDDATLTLEAAGWHAIGNPFFLPVRVGDLRVNDTAFDAAVTAGWVEGTLYRWKIASGQPDAYESVTRDSLLELWEGYWLRTKQDNLALTIPAPSGVDTAQVPLPASFRPPIARPVLVQPPLVNADGAFDLRLELYADFSSDGTTTLGTRPHADVQWDPLDHSEPPTLGHTVAAYFDHTDWEEEAGLYNTDYRPALKPGEQHTWQLTAFTDKPDARMTLSWEQTIKYVPDDIMLYFRQSGTSEIANPHSEIEWHDMRKVRSVDLSARSLITKVRFEVRAERFEMVPLSDVKVVAGEKQVTIQWAASDHPFIEGYIIERTAQGEEEPRLFERFHTHEFVDTEVEEEATYTYQVSVRFKSGAQLQSALFTVTVLPVIEKTVLLPSYPNPGNPAVWIPYELAGEAPVSIKIYNTAGQLVRTFHPGVQARGRYRSREKAVYWDGRTQSGDLVASGVYLYVLEAGAFVTTQKMVLLR